MLERPYKKFNDRGTKKDIDLYISEAYPVRSNRKKLFPDNVEKLKYSVSD